VIIQTGKEITNITHKPDTPLKSKTDLNNIQIMINDETAHTPELGPSIVHTEQEEPIIDTNLGSDNLLAGFHTSQGLFLDRQKPVLKSADIRREGRMFSTG
jgi:hypothetical protein